MQHVKHLIIGNGEVGSAVFTCLNEYTKSSVGLRDVREPDVDVKADTLHICFPYSDSFDSDVSVYESQYEPELVVVHSTVPVGTCDPNGWVHSPVRGQHPFLVEGIRSSVKWFGSAAGDSAAEAARQWRTVSRVDVMPSAADAEAAKLWELVQYGVAIKVEKAMYEWCATAGVDFDFVYTRMAESYNDAMIGSGNARFVRPVIEHVPGPIGGHCVRDNSPMVGHPLGDWVGE